MLDGWRAISILLVLACHQLPLGPARFGGNSAAGLMGMALFFTLSGFLITSTLDGNPAVVPFVIRRATRILPLATVGTVVYLSLQGKGLAFYAAHFAFIVNYDHAHLTPGTGHYWSLCIEVQFYVAIALIVAMAGRRGLKVLPLLGLAVTAIRVFSHEPASIVTHFRVDEILAGSTLALLHRGAPGKWAHALRRMLTGAPSIVWAVAYVLSCFSWSGPLQYLRPYLAAALVGSTLFGDARWFAAFTSRPMRYVAEISYALYVIHPLSTHGWLGSGPTLVKYAKRPLAFLITFGLAHVSTFRFEKWWIAFGKRMVAAVGTSTPREIAGTRAGG